MRELSSRFMNKVRAYPSGSIGRVLGQRARRQVLGMAIALPAALSLLPSGVAAQTWPARPIKLVVPYPAGGNADQIGRLIAERLSNALGQQVVVENRAGAGA
ncbi:MAG: hypothetical protein RLZ51_2382, partial [Pseudomonadota bacterium]